MRKATVAAMLLSLATWLYPLHVASAEIKTAPKLEQVLRPSNEPTVLQQPLPQKSISSNAKQLVRRNNASGSESHRDSQEYSGKVYSKEEVQDLIREYSATYGISADVPLCIAKLESGFNQFSKNKTSLASGVFQYLTSTWKATDEGKAGLSAFDADANIKAAIKYMAIQKNTRPWVVGPKCPKLIFTK